MIDIKDINDYTVTTINSAQANLKNAEEFKQEMIEVIDSGKHFVIIDFTNVEYVDSTFLSALVTVLKHAMKEKGDVAVYGLNADISNLFSLIRLDKAFKIFNSLPERFNSGSTD